MRLLGLLTVIWCLAGAAFAGWYLAHDYAELRDFYLAQGELYREGFWATTFFTPATKSAGDRFAVLALVVGVAAAVYLLVADWRRPRGEARQGPRVPVEGADLLALGGIALGLGGLWAYATHTIPVTYDEAFSAVYASGAGWFTALSYYMLPNNHVLFNVLNAILFGWAGDLVTTGRLISLIAFVLAGALQYAWLRTVLKRRDLAVASVLLLSVLLPIWGFAAQARGYMLLLTFSWGAFVALWWYLFRAAGARGLSAFAACTALGYATVPVFLYVHLGLLSGLAAALVWRRRWDWRIVATQAIAGVGSLTFYLPAVTFSGLAAITGNRYVVSGSSFREFAAGFLPTLPDYVNQVSPVVAAWGALLLPAAVLLALAGLSLRPEGRRIASLCLLSLAASLGVVLLMRVTPFYRTLLFQIQFAVAAVIVAGVWGVQRLSRTPVANRLALGILSLATVGLAYTGPREFYIRLYYYDINSVNDQETELLKQIPPEASVWCSDETSHARYLLDQRGVRTLGQGADPRTDYLLRRPGEVRLPEGAQLVATGADLELYRLP